jgi:cytoskeleton protein RodZ
VTTYWQPHQVEQLRAIGLRLQQERERQNIILEDISAKTRIRVALLQGIEAAEVNRLPEPVYVRGFIRRFEETLGLPSGELSNQLALEPTILGNVEPLMTYPPSGAASRSETAQKEPKKELRKESKPAQEAVPTFRAPSPEPAPVAAPVTPRLETPIVDVRPQASPVEAKPLASVSINSEVKAPEIKAPESEPSPPPASLAVRPIEPIAKPKPLPPSDPWAEDPRPAAASDRAADRDEVRIVPAPTRNLDAEPIRQSELERQKAASAALLPMPKPRTFDEPEPLPWRPIALVLGLLGLVGALGWGVTSMLKSPQVTTNPAPAAPTGVTAKPSPLAPRPAPKPAAPVSLAIDLKQASWMVVEADGKQIYEGELPKGTKKTWTAQKQIFFRTGLASVVWVSVNGAPAKQFSNYPGPKDETFLPTSKP